MLRNRRSFRLNRSDRPPRRALLYAHLIYLEKAKNKTKTISKNLAKKVRRVKRTVILRSSVSLARTYPDSMMSDFRPKPANKPAPQISSGYIGLADADETTAVIIDPPVQHLPFGSPLLSGRPDADPSRYDLSVRGRQLIRILLFVTRYAAHAAVGAVSVAVPRSRGT